MAQAQPIELNKLPPEGFQLLIEYQHVTKVDLKNMELIKKEIVDFFKNNNEEIAETIELGDPNSEYTLTFVLPDGYLNVQCFPKLNNFVSFDLNVFEQSKQQFLEAAYIHFAAFFGNLQCKTSFFQQKGGDNKFLLNSNEFTSAIYKNMKMVHRQKSQAYEIRVFDNEFLERILCLDDQIKLIGKIDNDYNKDMTREVINENQEIEKVLVLGGANTQIATYLLAQFQKIKRIVVCDIDKEVLDVVLKFFKNAQEIEKAMKEQKLQFIYENGGKYVKDQAEKGEKFDAIIIDTPNSNQGNWNDKEKCIFTKEFYENLKKILKESGKISQQVVNDMIKERFETIAKEADLKIEYINSKTDDYGLDLPIAICKL